MQSLRYVCCQPAQPYYLWQIEVVIQNFMRMGINPNMMDIVCGHPGTVPDDFRKLQRHYNTVRFFFYPDTRPEGGNNPYPPSIYFNLMKQHVAAHPSLKNDALFTHDADIVLTKPVDFSKFLNDDVWYFSDTASYIGYDYIVSKGRYIYDKMCEIVGIDPLIPKLMRHASGGAQYIVKNSTPEFWEKVEQDSMKLYAYFCKIEPVWQPLNPADSYPIQKWTAGMWAFLWNAWKFGFETVTPPELNFGWVTNDVSEVWRYPILHNSGVVVENPSSARLFKKTDYMYKLPYKESLDIDKTKASYFYWTEVLETGKKSILL